MKFKRYVLERCSNILFGQLVSIPAKQFKYRNIVYRLSIKNCKYEYIREFEELHDLYYESRRLP